MFTAIIHTLFELNLVFMWNCALWKKFLFFKSFLLVLTKFSFWLGDWTLGYHSVKFRHLPQIFWFPKIQLVWQLVRQLVHTMFVSDDLVSLVVKVKFDNTSKKSQNIIKMSADQFRSYYCISFTGRMYTPTLCTQKVKRTKTIIMNLRKTV